MGSNIIVGGGVSGLFSAYLLKQKYQEDDVVLIERSPHLGGLLQSVHYEGYGFFDYGVHTFYETGIEEIDAFFQSHKPKGGWNYLEGYYRDVGGSFWNGKINYNSPYLDVPANVSKGKLELYKKECLSCCEKNVLTQNEHNNAYDYMVYTFGKSITDDILVHLVEKRQGHHPKELHPIVVKVQGLARLVLFTIGELLTEYEHLQLAKVSAFPDQLDYPSRFLPNKRAYYPSHVGLTQVIELISDTLKDIGVITLNNSYITKLQFDKESIAGAEIMTDGTLHKIQDIKRVVWTVPMFPLIDLFPNDNLNLELEPPRKTIVANLVVKMEPNSGGLYYIYCHDVDFMHRISFPDNYALHRESDGYKISVECIIGSDIDDEMVMKEITDFLVSHQIIGTKDDILMSSIEKPVGGYPSFALKNLRALTDIRTRLEKCNIRNLYNVGILSKENMFFQFQILEHCFYTISQIMEPTDVTIDSHNSL